MSVRLTVEVNSSRISGFENRRTRAIGTPHRFQCATRIVVMLETIDRDHDSAGSVISATNAQRSATFASAATARPFENAIVGRAGSTPIFARDFPADSSKELVADRTAHETRHVFSQMPSNRTASSSSGGVSW
jgi:hypothetical protein